MLVVARPRNEDGSLGLPSLAIVDVDAPGFTRDGSRCPPGPRQAVAAVLRRCGDRRGPPDRRRERRPRPGVRRAQPRADHGRVGGGGRGPAGARAAADYARERKVWSARRSAPTRAMSHPLAEAKIELELARLMTQKAAALYDAGAKGAGEASNMAKYAAAEAAIHCVDQAIQTHGGNGFALEYGLAADVVGRAAGAHRPGLARDDPQLRGRAFARAAEVLRARRERVGCWRSNARAGARSRRTRPGWSVDPPTWRPASPGAGFPRGRGRTRSGAAPRR